MLKFLILVALVVPSAWAYAAETDNSATSTNLSGNLPGNLIDELIRKNGGDTEVKTAESALPTKRDERASKKESKNKESIPSAEASEPIFHNDQAIKKAPREASQNIWARMAISLAIALGVFGGVVYGFKKWPGAKKITQRAKMIEVLNQHHLGPKKSLAVVRVAGETVLIGITDQNISLLKTLSLLDDDVPNETKEARFILKNDEAAKFQKTLSSKAVAKPESREEDFSMQGLKEFIGDRLKNMKELS